MMLGSISLSRPMRMMGMRSPSWYISVALPDMLPGTMPPTS